MSEHKGREVTYDAKPKVMVNIFPMVQFIYVNHRSSIGCYIFGHFKHDINFRLSYFKYAITSFYVDITLGDTTGLFLVIVREYVVP